MITPRTPSSLRRTRLLSVRVVMIALALIGADARPGFSQTDAQSRTIGGATDVPQPVVRTTQAVRVSEPPVLDGRLDDAAWQGAEVLGGFTQREPVEGATPADATEVRFVYDDEALYIGARMYGDPAEIRADVTRRDVEGGAEQIVISLDTYRDRKTAYTFAVTASGVRIDYYHSSDNENDRDYSFDPVWEARTSLDSQGWTAEIRIPLTQLRFNRGQELVWGVNVVRRRPSRQESAYWSLVGREETGWSSRMGELRGIVGVAPSRRIELMPYVATSARMTNAEIAANDPFTESTDASVRVGGDLKVGLGPNLTLDATFNPDFGQVEADPAVVNLSAFETFFEERRPFFTEGAQLFNAGDLFYSRRIGASPHGWADGENDHFVESSENTTILGAAKVTGRLPSGLSVGVLGALTDEESVATYDTLSEDFGSAVVEPLTSYGVVRMDQQFGADGSNVGFMITNVNRRLGGNDLLSSILVENAVTGVAGGRYRWGGGKYDMTFEVQGSYLTGSADAILAQQTNSRRYYQRPDADYVDLDSTATSLFGYVVSASHSKMGGEHWLWDIDAWAESPGFESNDMGANSIVDALGMFAGVTWRETDPGRFLRNYSARVMTANEINYGGVYWGSWVGLNLSGTLANFAYFEIGVDVNPPVLAPRATRGGPLMRSNGFNGAFAGYQSPSGRDFGWSLWGGGGRDLIGGSNLWINPDFSYRPSPRLELSVGPSFSRSIDPRQYIDAVEGDNPATYGTRYIFSWIDYSELSASLRLNYAIRPDLTLETYAQPFAAVGRYSGFGELEEPETNDLIVYGEDEGTTIARDADGNYVVTDGAESFTIGDPDFQAVSFRSNVVLRWEWRPGSTLFLVWQQDRSGGSAPDRTVRPGDLGEAFGDDAIGNNYFAIKATYWLPL
ncbi:MAG TPA: DUF5916 domain-containing protein [Longimicrobiales bacterium]